MLRKQQHLSAFSAVSAAAAGSHHPPPPPQVIALLKAAVNFLPTPFALDTSGLLGRRRWRSAAVSLTAASGQRGPAQSLLLRFRSTGAGFTPIRLKLPTCTPAPDPKHDEGSETANTRMDAGNETTFTLVVGRRK